MWRNFLALASFPLAGSVIGLATLYAIDRLILPLHHTAATTDGILFLECAVLVLLLGGLVWDKSQVIRRSLQMKRPKHHELFTWSEIGKVMACLGASMVIFVAVVKVLDLKTATQGTGQEHTNSAEPSKSDKAANGLGGELSFIAAARSF